MRETRKLIFEIPDNENVMVLLLDAVPPDWVILHGILEAPRALRESGRAAGNTGLTFDSFHNVPIIEGRYCPESQSTAVPDVYALVAEGRLPGFLWFNRARLGGSGALTFAVGKNIATAYVRKGYRGILSFLAREHGEGECPAECSFCLPGFVRKSFLKGRPPEYPTPAASINWNGERDGAELCSSVVRVCRSLELRELDHVPVE